MTDLLNELNNLSVKYHFKSKKKLSQNFLINENVLNEMVEQASLNEKDIVLEIGAGTGFLTKKILEKGCKVIAVERDETLAEVLKNEIKSDRINLIEGDFLKEEIPSFNKVVSSPPYHISSDIMFKLYELKFDSAVMLFQREFAGKLSAEPGFREYIALSVLNDYFCETSFIEGISPSSFYPCPPTSSSIIKLNWNKRFGEAIDDQLFTEFIKTIFRYKKKNLSAALRNSLPFLKERMNLNEKKSDGLELSEEKVYLLETKQLVEIFNELIE
ncbi:MAG: 16S rRNA (adenine(1518)-N(6)/adenine(1519)-N(6))-dimethyltransferase RsmA [archaeon]